MNWDVCFPVILRKVTGCRSLAVRLLTVRRSRLIFALKKLENYSADKRIFMYINFSAIHYPNCHYVKGKTKDDKESHAAALRYIDSQLPRLFEVFQKRADTLVIALSDHGTCYGEDGYEYHCISHETVYTVPYKHFILTKQ